MRVTEEKGILVSVPGRFHGIKKQKEILSGLKQDNIVTIGEGDLHFFHPPPCESQPRVMESLSKGKKDRSGKRKTAGYNNNSLTFKIVFKETTIFFPGDIMSVVEKDLSENLGKQLKSDILIAPHHGSSTSSTDFLLDQVAPDSVIISCGWKNRFAFPHKSVMDRYKNKGIKIYRTDFNGALRIYSDGIRWEIETAL